jgi:hypothetical protein
MRGLWQTTFTGWINWRKRNHVGKARNIKDEFSSFHSLRINIPLTPRYVYLNMWHVTVPDIYAGLGDCYRSIEWQRRKPFSHLQFSMVFNFLWWNYILKNFLFQQMYLSHGQRSWKFLSVIHYALNTQILYEWIRKLRNCPSITNFKNKQALRKLHSHYS